MVSGLDNIGIAVRDVDKSMAFYRLLGFVPDFATPESAMLRLGNVALYLFRTDTPSRQHRSFDLSGNSAGIDHLSFKVADVDAACASLRASGVAVEREPRDYDWGARAACIRDPDGNCIWLLQR